MAIIGAMFDGLLLTLGIQPGKLGKYKPRVESIGDVIRLVLLILSPYLFWLYSNKFLGMSIDYLTSMARDIPVAGTQMNPSFYPMEKLALFVGGLILVCFLLV